MRDGVSLQLQRELAGDEESLIGQDYGEDDVKVCSKGAGKGNDRQGGRQGGGTRHTHTRTHARTHAHTHTCFFPPVAFFDRRERLVLGGWIS